MSEEQNNKQEEQKIKRGKNFDVFISYRRSDGTDKAKQLDLAFSIDDCRTFFDFKSLGTGAFDKRLENAVLDAPIFIMVWTPDYFKRCVKGGETADGKTVLEPDEDDWVRKEIELALENGKKIIPINFNHVFDKVPDYLDDEFRNKISPHNYVNLYGDNTFDATVKHIFDKEIRPFIGATPKPENKVKVRVKADADCELIDNDEVIATIQQGKTAQLFFERGEYELIARSTEFSDIENVIERTFDDVSFSYFVKTELAYRVKQRRIQIEEEEKKKREEEERLRREEEERIRREEEERRRREEEQRLEEQRKKEEEQRRKEEQARLEAERQRQEYLRKEEEARKLLEQERERQRREAEERRREEQTKKERWERDLKAENARLSEIKAKEKNEERNVIYRRLGCGAVIFCIALFLICFMTCVGSGRYTETATETATETPAIEEIPSDYDETRLPEIYSIEIGNATYDGDAITDYGEKIYSSETMYLHPRIRYKSYADREYKFDVKWIEPDGALRSGDGSPKGYSYSRSYSLSYGEGNEYLHGWGKETKGNWYAGKYAIEIWCEGTLLKRKEFRIY
ncbi:MAG: toll/interleukin-1 receptor domain-containing protein [Bacteroidales bacterium]|nr:toll/interleukin-1 receptor domain-containing protein [Bacteroidales bacterium]